MPGSQKPVTVGCASAFWGDTGTAAAQLVLGADVDYVVFDYLAEITLSILAGARAKNASLGYATDFPEVITPLLGDLSDRGIRLIANAGGLNPYGCRDALLTAAAERGLSPTIAVVLGDDLMGQSTSLREHGVTEIDTGAPLPARLSTLNAYLGARPIVAALDAGADIVITGRCVDSALVLAPLIHEFGWLADDYHKLAQGSLAGHLIECGTQCTGGNFTDWHRVNGFNDMGFPIVSVTPDGRFEVSKPDNTGGMVSTGTVAEQLLYEIGDPADYKLPDVTCDFTGVTLEQTGRHRVRVHGARGRPPPATLKAAGTWHDGYRCTALFVIGGIAAAEKANSVCNALLTKCSRLMAERGLGGFSRQSVEILGSEATYGPHRRVVDSREVVAKLAVAHLDAGALTLFSREIAQAATAMAPGITSLIGGRPRVQPVIRLTTCLVDRDRVQVSIDLGEGRELPVADAPSTTGGQAIPARSGGPLPDTPGTVHVPLVRLALARSGDKGDHCNIGVIARRPEYLPYIRAALTEQAVAAYMAHVLDKDHGKVTRWDLPGIHALNLLLEHALGGGGVASLRIDPQGKAFAQQLLEFPVLVPAELAEPTDTMPAR